MEKTISIAKRKHLIELGVLNEVLTDLEFIQIVSVYKQVIDRLLKDE